MNINKTYLQINKCILRTPKAVAEINRLRQGSSLSHFLFTVYIEEIIKKYFKRTKA